MSKHVKRILFVDDSEPDVRLCEGAANRSYIQYDIRHAFDVQTAMQWLMGSGVFQRRNLFPIPDAIVIDLRMPGAEGLQLLEWIRNRAELKNLPVIVHTHSQAIGDAVLSNVRGVTQYIIKDGECRRLMQYLEQLFENGSGGELGPS